MKSTVIIHTEKRFCAKCMMYTHHEFTDASSKTTCEGCGHVDDPTERADLVQERAALGLKRGGYAAGNFNGKKRK